MELQTTPPTAAQVLAHVKKHPLHEHKDKKKRGTQEVYLYRPNGGGYQATMRVGDMNALALWLAKLPNTPVQLVRMRVIKGVVYQRSDAVFPWHALTGDWAQGKYLPLTREGLPVDYQPESEDDYTPTNYFGADGKVKFTL